MNWKNGQIVRTHRSIEAYIVNAELANKSGFEDVELSGSLALMMSMGFYSKYYAFESQLDIKANGGTELSEKKEFHFNDSSFKKYGFAFREQTT